MHEFQAAFLPSHNTILGFQSRGARTKPKLLSRFEKSYLQQNQALRDTTSGSETDTEACEVPMCHAASLLPAPECCLMFEHERHRRLLRCKGCGLDVLTVASKDHLPSSEISLKSGTVEFLFGLIFRWVGAR